VKRALFALAMLLPATAGIFPYPYTLDDFANGLRLISIPTDSPNLVTLYVVVSAGSRNEVEPGKTGFAHLFEHVMFRGTEKYPPAAYRRILQVAGTDANAFTGVDLTAYHMSFSKPDLDTILMLEADRFQHLKYSADAFRTETLAVLGEYNKNSANPFRKLDDAMRATAFEHHPYRHSSMGWLADIQSMPGQYDYSLQFFDRYYRPEYTTLVLAGDIDAKAVRKLVERYWGAWPRGHYQPKIPAEPSQIASRTQHVEWPSATLPWISIAFRTPAYNDAAKDTAALSALAFLAFSQTSAVYHKLVVETQKVDLLSCDNPAQVDPGLFTIVARMKKGADLPDVQAELLAAVERFREELVPPDRLQAVKSHLLYRFVLGLDNSESIAEAVARVVPLARTPATIDRLYGLYEQLTPEDIRDAARRYLKEESRTIVTLTGPGGAR
jgi:zinc protease